MSPSSANARGALQAVPGKSTNAARVSPLSGRYHPKKYTSPLDTKNLLTPEEFHRQFVKNNSKNPYTEHKSINEVPGPVKRMRQSVESPVTPVTASSTAQRSDTQTSLGGDTYIENDDYAPSGWYALSLPRYAQMMD